MRRGPQKFRFSFDAAAMTRYGGLVLFRQFCKSLDLRHFLQLYVRWPDYHYRSYHPVDLFLAHVFALVAGLGRIENTQAFTHNGLIPAMLGLPDFPHRDTLRTFLWRFQAPHLQALQQVHDRLRLILGHRLGLVHSAIVDADTTTLVTYGHQEGVATGYLPKRRHGHVSYAPILSSEGRTGLSLGLDLRSGNVHANTGTLAFLQTMLQKLPSSVAVTRTRIRLDGAFYNHGIAEFLDEERIGYAIVAHFRSSLVPRMVQARYHPFASGWEAGEFTYTPFNWQKPHRFIAVRRPKHLDPEKIQRRLFTFQDHTYHRVIVTNLPLTPEAVWRLYCNRGFQELLIREFKDAYGLSQIPTSRFLANATYMETILWAYDLVLTFQFLCLPQEIQHWNISTLRRELWWLPAEWVHHGNRNVLRLPTRYPHQDRFLRIYRAAQRVRSLL